MRDAIYPTEGSLLVPAKAGTWRVVLRVRNWIPGYAGMTVLS